MNDEKLISNKIENKIKRITQVIEMALRELYLDGVEGERKYVLKLLEEWEVEINKKLANNDNDYTEYKIIDSNNTSKEEN